jgi:sugar phosphate isomerase/epimerase
MMKVNVGVKTDPIESRYSYEWLFDLLRAFGVHRVQLGTTYSVYQAEDGYFRQLRKSAEKRGVRISSVFAAHRDFIGFASGDRYLEEASMKGWRRLIEVAALCGADSAGANGFFVMRDQPHTRERGIATFHERMKELLPLARKAGLSAITVEPMSSIYEWPATPAELIGMFDALAPFLAENRSTAAPLLLCADISHGIADAERRVVHDNWSLFEMEIPWMWEFHFKNTDTAFDRTFGFSAEERARGIVDLSRLKKLIAENASRFPAKEITGYFETSGPKTGREYSDPHLGAQLEKSLAALTAAFDGKETSS